MHENWYTSSLSRILPVHMQKSRYTVTLIIAVTLSTTYWNIIQKYSMIVDEALMPKVWKKHESIQGLAAWSSQGN